VSTVAHNERLAKRRNDKRVRAAKAAHVGPCGYCGTDCRSDVCSAHRLLRNAYREDDDRWQSNPEE
jgi:hypothetical protein